MSDIDVKVIYRRLLEDPNFTAPEGVSRSDAAWTEAWQRYRQHVNNERALSFGSTEESMNKQIFPTNDVFRKFECQLCKDKGWYANFEKQEDLDAHGFQKHLDLTKQTPRRYDPRMVFNPVTHRYHLREIQKPFKPIQKDTSLQKLNELLDR